MSVAIREHDVTVLLGDVREQLATLPDESVNCVVTSPPYYGLRDYGTDGQIGLEPSPAEYVETMRAVFVDVRRVLAADGVLWLNIGDSYAHLTRSGAQGATGQRATRAFTPEGLGGHSGLPDKNLMGMPWRVALALQDDGWTLRNDVIWSKPNAMPESVTDRLSTRYEHVFLFSKSRRYWFDLDLIREPLAYPNAADGTRTFGGANKADALTQGSSARRTGGTYGRTWEQRKAEGEPMRYGLAGQSAVGKGGLAADPRGRNPGDVWTIPTSPSPGAHFACFPPALARRCILAGCPAAGTVLDPFAGSGTTLMVARQLVRKSIGIELNPDYIDIIRQRIGPEPFQFGEVTA